MEMRLITGMDIGAQIIQALGLPKETSLIQIRIGVNEVVEVICRYYPTNEDLGNMLPILQSYHVVPNGGPMIDDTFLGEPVMRPIRHKEEEYPDSNLLSD